MTSSPVLQDFLSQNGWDSAVVQPVGEDMSPRRYTRLSKNGRTAILIESPPDDDPRSIPGHKLRDFIRIAESLRDAGLHAPVIYDADEANGLILLEDFGDESFQNSARPQKELYTTAVDVLRHMHQSNNLKGLSLPAYGESHVHTARRRVVDWYIPAVRQEQVPDGLAESYLAVWDDIESALPQCPSGFIHADYHVGNLMVLSGEVGLKQCGILDFQGAMQGPVSYDLANLLENARVDVPLSLREAMLARFCEGMTKEESETFLPWYRVLATQFHCRAIGQFIRMAIRDNKTGYLQHIPRIAAYLQKGLADPLLKPLKNWFATEKIDFTDKPDMTNLGAIKAFISKDAF